MEVHNEDAVRTNMFHRDTYNADRDLVRKILKRIFVTKVSTRHWPGILIKKKKQKQNNHKKTTN
jgi:hypothetical protein